MNTISILIEDSITNDVFLFHYVETQLNIQHERVICRLEEYLQFSKFKRI